jgi:hypothetical protein
VIIDAAWLAVSGHCCKGLDPGDLPDRPQPVADFPFLTSATLRPRSARLRLGAGTGSENPACGPTVNWVRRGQRTRSLHRADET